MKEILSKINKLVTPSKSAEKHKSNIANEILKRVFEEIDGRLEIKGAEFGGSYPKGTWLPQSADIDIFVRLIPKFPRKSFLVLAYKPMDISPCTTVYSGTA